VVFGFGEALAGGVDLGFGGAAVRPRLGLHRLAGLDRLVDLEEVLDLEPLEFRHVVDVAQVLHPGVGGGHAQHLVVAAHLVPHPEHPDDAAVDQAAGEGRFVEEYQRVQRIAVLAQRVLDEAVVRRVSGRGEQHAVQPDPAGGVVHLVLVPLSHGDLDNNVNVHWFAPGRSG
jgi:hypothetical protein